MSRRKIGPPFYPRSSLGEPITTQDRLNVRQRPSNVGMEAPVGGEVAHLHPEQILEAAGRRMALPHLDASRPAARVTKLGATGPDGAAAYRSSL